MMCIKNAVKVKDGETTRSDGGTPLQRQMGGEHKTDIGGSCEDRNGHDVQTYLR